MYRRYLDYTDTCTWIIRIYKHTHRQFVPNGMSGAGARTHLLYRRPATSAAPSPAPSPTPPPASISRPPPSAARPPCSCVAAVATFTRHLRQPPPTALPSPPWGTRGRTGKSMGPVPNNGLGPSGLDLVCLFQFKYKSCHITCLNTS